MKLLSKHFIICFLVMSFTVATLYCCCFSFLQPASKKHHCCMMKKEPQKAASHDCVHCNDAFKTDVTVKDKSHIAAVASFSTLTSERAISLVSVNAVKSLYVNGPPGPMHVVPLYLQLHTLRI